MSGAPDDAEVRNRLDAAHRALDEAEPLLERLKESLRQAQEEVAAMRLAVEEDHPHDR